MRLTQKPRISQDPEGSGDIKGGIDICGETWTSPTSQKQPYNVYQNLHSTMTFKWRHRRHITSPYAHCGRLCWRSSPIRTNCSLKPSNKTDGTTERLTGKPRRRFWKSARDLPNSPVSMGSEPVGKTNVQDIRFFLRRQAQNFENTTLVARRREHFRVFLAIFLVAQLSPKRGVFVHKNSLSSCQRCRHSVEPRALTDVSFQRYWSDCLVPFELTPHT